LKNRSLFVVVLDGRFKTGFSGTQRYCVIPGINIEMFQKQRDLISKKREAERETPKKSFSKNFTHYYELSFLAWLDLHIK
jgi:hypothetical protein